MRPSLRHIFSLIGVALLLAGCYGVVRHPGKPTLPPFPERSPTPGAVPSLPLASPVPATNSLPATLPPTLTPSEAESSPLPPTASSTSTPTETAAVPSPTLPAPLPERSHYQLSVVLDYPAHHVVVTETITYANALPAALPDLMLVVAAAHTPGVFRLNTFSWEDGSAVEGYTLEDTLLRIPLAQPLPSQGRVRMVLGYELEIPETPGPLSYTSRQVNLGDWYPFVPPFRLGPGWLAYSPWGVGETLVAESADFDVDIQVIGAPEGLIAAASSWGEQIDQRYRYHLEAARSFTWSASPDYYVSQSVVGQTLVTQYAFPEHVEEGQVALQVTANAVALYSELFGPLPRTSLAAVEADFFDGMEYDGLYFLGRSYFDDYPGTPQGYLTALSAHETAHQWWYALVGNDAAEEPWLDEALCTYSERLYYERYHPDLVEWWWEFRADRFHPEGWVDGRVYDHQSFRGYVNAVYLQGAHFLEDLRSRVGDEAFLAALKDYATRGSGHLMTGATFFDILRDHTSADFSDLIAEYFHALPQP